MKKIRMIKSVYDNQQAATVDDYYNDTSKLLIAHFFGDGHPFRERMRRKVFDDEMEKRRIKLMVTKMEEYRDPNQTGDQAVIIYVHQLLLEVVMKDPALEYDFADEGKNAMQTHYINGMLGEYINEQCFNVPTQDMDETERFLHYLAQDIPRINDYFRIIDV